MASFLTVNVELEMTDTEITTIWKLRRLGLFTK